MSVTTVTLSDIADAAIRGGLEPAAVHQRLMESEHGKRVDARRRDEFATAAMAARLGAAWSSPTPSNAAYRTWVASQPPDCNDTGHHRWIAEVSYEQADAMMKARAA